MVWRDTFVRVYNGTDVTRSNDAFCAHGEEPAVGIIAEQSVGRGAADRVFFEVNVGWRRPGQRCRSVTLPLEKL